MPEITTDNSRKFGDIRGILHYVPQFRGQIFVVHIDSGVIEHENFMNVLLDLAVLQSLSIRVVVVFGAREQIRLLAEKRGIILSNPDATGVTDDATLDVAVDAITRLGSLLMQHLTMVGLRTAMPNAVIAHPAGVIGGKDLIHTGTVDRIEVQTLKGMIDDGLVPLIAPLGYERQGRTLRVNGVAMAVQVALSIQAAKILFVGPSVVVGADGKGARHLLVKDAAALAERLPEDSVEAIQLKHAARACEGGVQRVHFIDGTSEEALLGELFSAQGTGTMIHLDAYQHIRPARRADVPAMLSMVKRAVSDQELVARSARELRESIANYSLLEVDGILVGMVSVHLFPETTMAEIGSLFIRASHEGRGYGSLLVQYAEKRARELGASTVIALSTQAYNFFVNKLRYASVDPEILPEARRARREKSGRNSLVLLKKLH